MCASVPVTVQVSTCILTRISGCSFKMANCKVCLKAIKSNQFKVKCSDCPDEFHGKCVNPPMTSEDIKFLNEEGNAWRCDSCKQTRRASMRLEYGSTEAGVTLEMIMNMLKEIKDQQKKSTTDFNTSYEALHNEVEENTKTLKQGMENIEKYMKEIDQLKSENTALKSKVANLEARMDEMENYSRRNCLEIQGVPEEKDEVVTEVVKKIGKALKVNIEESMIDVCHRFGRRTAKQTPRGIMVKFVRRTDKELLMNRRRERRGDFSTRHLDLPTDTPVYLNDSLSPARRWLFAKARQFKKEKHYKYIWLRNGNILMKKEDGSETMEIKTEADLSEL